MISTLKRSPAFAKCPIASSTDHIFFTKGSSALMIFPISTSMAARSSGVNGRGISMS
jgi:hypothetical protein